jgi:hypothetical protein
MFLFPLSRCNNTDVKQHIGLEVPKIRNCYKLLIVTLSILALSCCLCSENYVFAQTDSSALKLQAANSVVGKAFSSVLEAEKAGGNVSQLLVRLNTAGKFLTDAQNAYNSGNSSNVTSMVENALQIANEVNGDAVNLRNASLVESQNSFWLTLTFSIVGAVVFSASLLFIWRRFKRSFIKKLLSMKPEVAQNTA